MVETGPQFAYQAVKTRFALHVVGGPADSAFPTRYPTQSVSPSLAPTASAYPSTCPTVRPSSAPTLTTHAGFLVMLNLTFTGPVDPNTHIHRHLRCTDPRCQPGVVLADIATDIQSSIRRSDLSENPQFNTTCRNGRLLLRALFAYPTGDVANERANDITDFLRQPKKYLRSATTARYGVPVASVGIFSQGSDSFNGRIHNYQNDGFDQVMWMGIVTALGAMGMISVWGLCKCCRFGMGLSIRFLGSNVGSNMGSNGQGFEPVALDDMALDDMALDDMTLDDKTDPRDSGLGDDVSYDETESLRSLELDFDDDDEGDSLH